MYDTPPAPSLASRFPALKSRETCRGFAIVQNRVVHFESHLELMVLFMLALRVETAKLLEQPMAFTYWDDGVLRRHTFDFLVITHDGRNKYVAVKPAARVVRSGIKRTLGLVVAQLPLNSNISVHLVTDADFTYADRYNATQAFDFWRFPNKEHDERMTPIASQIMGSARIADLVEFSGLGAMGFRSIVRLIVNGQLAAINPRERITYDSLVRSAPAMAASAS